MNPVHTILPPPLDSDRLRHIRRSLVRDAPGRQEEQRHQRTTADAGIVMRSRAGTSPPGALPALHALELGAEVVLVELDHAVDLAVGVLVVLARELVLALHVHRGDGEVARLCARQRDLAPAVLLPRQLRLGYPPFLEALPHQAAKVLVVRVARSVLLVQAGF